MKPLLLFVFLFVASVAHAQLDCHTNAPCQNGGTCPTSSQSTCTCPPRYTGTACEQELVPCAPSQCVGGVCVLNATLPSGFSCICRAGFSGTLCEVLSANDIASSTAGLSRYLTWDTVIVCVVFGLLLILIVTVVRKLYRTHVAKTTAPFNAAAQDILMARATTIRSSSHPFPPSTQPSALSPAATLNVTVPVPPENDSDVD